jgi:hypothetical protein
MNDGWHSRGHSPCAAVPGDLENELRSAAQNAIFLRNDEAKRHMEEARRHYREALQAIKGGASEAPKSTVPPASETYLDDKV